MIILEFDLLIIIILSVVFVSNFILFVKWFKLHVNTIFVINVFLDGLKLIDNGLIESAHDVSLGGIITAVAKMSICGQKGFELKKLKGLMNKFDYYFGEDQGRYIIEVDPKKLPKVQILLKESSVHFDEIGNVAEKEVIIDKDSILNIEDLIESNTNWLENYMNK